MYYTHAEKTVKKYSHDEAVSQALALIKDKGKVLDGRYLPMNPSKEKDMTLEQVNKVVTHLYGRSIYID